MTLQVECHRCGYDWKYTGNSEYYASCPQCKTSVPLEEPAEAGESPAPVDGSSAPADHENVEALAQRVERLESTASELHSAIETMMSRVAELEEMRAQTATRDGSAGSDAPAPTPTPSSDSKTAVSAASRGKTDRSSVAGRGPSADADESHDSGGGRVARGDVQPTDRRDSGTQAPSSGAKTASSGGIRPEADDEGSYDYICPSCDGPISGKPDACIHCGTGFSW